MRLVMPGGVNVLPGKRKTRAVLAYLCLARGERVARTRLMRLLWDQRGDSEARLSLRQAVAELVRVLEGEGPNPIETDRDTVRLDLRNLWIDALTSIDGGNRLLEDLEGVTPQLDEWIHAERKRVLTALRDAMDRELAQ
jgi:DNA-binding SARP family transcriptional activator